ncbi:unnamed protein product [Diatraea saccharalis]|uniref:G-protein coupled receptors family 1 profile domain-containing protein n=1 Tax=Diatraea saccharalis TaxID=40085 RepID=A0A9N9QPX4_9NEOP|nr:unnamed protein product [Diatraea saccharalis]
MHELMFFQPFSSIPESVIVEQELYWDAAENFSLDNFNLSVTYENGTRNGTDQVRDGAVNNWWALVALLLVVCTAAGNVLVCLAIYLERRLQNVTNYFLMSLAITDLLVAILVMPVGILTLVRVLKRLDVESALNTEIQ